MCIKNCSVIGAVRRVQVLGAVVALRLAFCLRVHAEDRLEGKYEFYSEEHGRVEVGTAGLRVEKDLGPNLTVRGQMVYDTISGATPTGGPPLPGQSQVPVTQMQDIRRAGFVEFTQKFGSQALTPQVAYSLESDYESVGVALNHSVELNQKNTTLLFGVAGTFDTISRGNSPYIFDDHDKDTYDFMVGVSQLLDQNTILAANVSVSYAEGFLSDPYKGVQFTGYPDFEKLFAEKRPGHRDRETLLLTLTRHFEPVRGSAELAYRLSHDSFGIWTHTAAFDWFQKAGSRVVINPFVRYYVQTAADFYDLSFPGDPSLSLDDVPVYYSADHRLSAMHTWTYGVKVRAQLTDWMAVEGGYRRYDMAGDDGKTPRSVYSQANVFTIGLSLWL